MKGYTRRVLSKSGLWFVFTVQLLCTLFFVLELVTEVFGLRNWAVSWGIRELLQVAASVGLIMGSVAWGLYLRATFVRMGRMRSQIDVARGAFQEVIEDWFDRWNLTPSERDVALFAVKGMTNREIAELRGKSEATVKVQMNAVLRKSGVSNRAQLMSFFVDELIGTVPARARAEDPAA
jgi:DNA-binding CsgD family transcriptional regulator